MKKILLTFALLGCIASVHAQGLRLSVKGAYNSTWLFNKDVSDAGDELDYKSTFGAQFGVGLLYNLTENAGIGADILFGGVNQKYTNRIPGGLNFETQTKLKTIDIPIFFRYTSDVGAYFEFGPQFTLLNDGEFESPLGNIDISEDLAGSYIAAMLGFGYEFHLTDNMLVAPGLRFAYGLGDVVEEPDGAINYEPTHALVGGINLTFSYDLGN